MPEKSTMILTGSRVSLGPRRRDLLPTYLRWINDPEVNCYLTMWGAAMSLEDEEKWYEGTGRPTERLFTVYHRETGEPVGNLGLHNIDFRNGTAEMGIVLGEKEYWDQGLGTEAVCLGLDFGFTALGLNVIRLRALSHNTRAIRCYEKAGFRVAGRMRQSHRIAGSCIDEVLMDILASEFASPVLGPMLKNKGIGNG